MTLRKKTRSKLLVETIMTFLELATKLAEQKGVPVNRGSFLCYDPGHTTGWAYFNEGELIDCGQLNTSELETSLRALQLKFTEFQVDTLVIEDYRVYKWKTDDHAWSSLYTTQLIGMMETLCIMHNIPLVKQPAHIAKSFATDKLLKDWGYWMSGARHARDAIRHGCYYVVFGGAKCQERKHRAKPHNVG